MMIGNIREIHVYVLPPLMQLLEILLELKPLKTMRKLADGGLKT